jgi:hypothetical protein
MWHFSLENFYYVVTINHKTHVVYQCLSYVYKNRIHGTRSCWNGVSQVMKNLTRMTSVNTWNRSPFWNTLSREFRCRWRHLSCKLRPEIDNRCTFTLITIAMRFKQIRKDIYRFWCQNGAILLLPFWLDNQS